MKPNIEQPWIEAGYRIFSKEGPEELKVDHMARAIGISRSSFYHLFADMDIFQEKLLAYHAVRAKQAAEKIKRCKTMDPDFLLLLMEEKEYILFNRQLRIHRENREYKKGFEEGIDLAAKEVAGIWTEMLGLQEYPDVSLLIFKMTADIFFHRLTEENMNYEWLSFFIKEINTFIRNVNKKH